MERRRRELEAARRDLEQKADQLAITSKYKSQFLANMSHELRTPLNSLLILSQQLADNVEGNLTNRQVEFASTIRESGNDLLTLINDILDISKIESGTTSIDVSPVPFAEICDEVDRTFRQVAQQKALQFDVEVDPTLPRSINTDATRLQQVLKNLLSNAFKFTEQGGVTMRIGPATGGWSADVESLNRARNVVAFAVTDTGIGIPDDKQHVIFEAFQQADMDTSRRFGGTGLGLAISREVAGLLGGEIKLASTPGAGSTFTLYLPLAYQPSAPGSGAGNGRRGDFPARGDRQPASPAPRSPLGGGSAGRAGRSGGSGGGVTVLTPPAAISATRGGDGTATLNVVGTETRPQAAAGVLERPRLIPGAVGTDGVDGADGEALTNGYPADGYAQDGVGGVDGVDGQDGQAAHSTEFDVADDRSNIQTDDRVLLIVEDDPRFAKVILDLARERGFKGVVALQGDTGLQLARRFKPDAITLDMQLPELDGWKVLDLLKHDPNTRHIPVHVISGHDQRRRALEFGAIAHVEKPVSRDALVEALDGLRSFVDRAFKSLLVVEDNEVQRNAIVELIGNGDVKTTAVRSGEEALEALRASRYDCVVLDLGLPDMTGFELIQKIRDEASAAGAIAVPIIVYTGKDLTRREEAQLRKLAETIIIKDAKSPERLLDETALFLHRVEARLPEPKRKMLRELHRQDPVLEGKKVLIVDDDMRNIFALTSALERYKMDIAYAENGRDAIDLVSSRQDVDVILMDIMMPEMDGYETMQRIREMPQFGRTPIIALTAKAMKGDREKCIEAGASDYITKPVDVDQLVSLLRVWLYQ